MHWALIRSSIFCAVSLFATGTALGFTLPSLIPSDSATALPLDWTAGFRVRPEGGQAFAWILSRNAAVYLALLMGLVTAGLSAFVLLLFNGALLGHTIGMALLVGVDMGRILRALPHALLELPALLIGGAVGLLGFPVFVRWLTSDAPLSGVPLGRMAGVILAGGLALTAAAFVEVWVSLRDSAGP